MAADAPLPTQVKSGAITAPAGCGKTHHVAQAIAAHSGEALPLLVLTHTNAGVAALKQRVAAVGASAKTCRIATIDGWSLRLLGAFPSRGEIDPSHLRLENPRYDYPAIRDGVLNIIQKDHIAEIIRSTYGHLIVDEYQDCQPAQHTLTIGLAKYLPVCVLGDPLQSIFGWVPGGTVDWDSEVLGVFGDAGTLRTPWRWKLAGNLELGDWLLNIRKPLLEGGKIDLRQAPRCVEWVELDGKDDWPKQLAAANTKSPIRDGGSLIMAKWPRDQAEYARRIPGASKVENADLSDLQVFASQFSPFGDKPLGTLLDFAGSVMTGIDRERLKSRLNSIQNKTNKIAPSEIELAILQFTSAPSYRGGAAILSEFSRDVGTRVFREELLRTAIKTLSSANDNGEQALHELAASIRDQSRFSGRQIPKKAVGSTLLFKGLEADVSIILDADVMDARDLYVALTRGSRRIVVCSHSPLLPADSR